MRAGSWLPVQCFQSFYMCIEGSQTETKRERQRVVTHLSHSQQRLPYNFSQSGKPKANRSEQHCQRAIAINHPRHCCPYQTSSAGDCLFPRLFHTSGMIYCEKSPRHVSFSHAFIVRQGGKAFTTVLYRILGVSVWPSPCVITRFAGCEQASQPDAPDVIIYSSCEKTGSCKRKHGPDRKGEKKYIQKQTNRQCENICLLSKANTKMLGDTLAAAWGCCVNFTVITTG